MHKLNQKGFSPIIVLASILDISLLGIITYKTAFNNTPQETPQPSPETTSSAKPASTTPSASLKASFKPTLKPSSSIKPSSSPTPQSSQNSPSNPSNNSSGNSNSSSSTSAPSPTPSPTEYPSESFSNNGLNVKATCKGSELNLYITGTISNPGASGSGIWMYLEDSRTGQSMVYEYVGGDPNAKVAANIPPVGPIRGSGGALTLSGDGRTYISRAYYAPYTNDYPNFNAASAEVSFSKKCI